MLPFDLSQECGPPVDIFFKSNKLAKVLNDGARLKKEYGENARFIKNRLAVLQAAVSLAVVSTTPPERRHLLTGSYAGHYAVDLQHPHRIVFVPADDPLPLNPDGGHALNRIKSITIIEIVDYH